MTIHDKLYNIINSIETLNKTATNPFFKSKYVSLPIILEEIKPILEANKTYISFTMLGHTVTLNFCDIETGESISSSLDTIGIQDMQKLGSGITYARRYLLVSFFNIQEVDDDGNKASNKEIEKKENDVAQRVLNHIEKSNTEEELNKCFKALTTEELKQAYNDKLNIIRKQI